MTNVELDPAEVVSKTSNQVPAPLAAGSGSLEILEPRDVPLGGLRAMKVRRTLPQKSRSLIGAWCFADQYGPQQVAETGGMTVAPHPHTGLQTVSWLFQGEIEHRDSVGSHAMVRPGELNLMTAGRGISHSEVSTPETTVLHGVQLWVALPDGARDMAPEFEHVLPEEAVDGGLRVPGVHRLLARYGFESNDPHAPARRRVGVAARYSRWSCRWSATHEHGVLVDAGEVTVGGAPVGPRNCWPTCRRATDRSRLTAGPSPARLILLGGLPLNEEILMWWNFIGRSHEEIVEYRRQWQAEISAFAAGAPPSTVFGRVHGYPGNPLPAPEMPGVRLRPRPQPDSTDRDGIEQPARKPDAITGWYEFGLPSGGCNDEIIASQSVS